MVCQAHASWGTEFQTRFTPLPSLPIPENAMDPARPLTIGYISPDLFTHSVSYFAEAPLAHHGSCPGLSHVVYDCTPRPDAKTERLEQLTKAAGGLWRPSSQLSEAALADQVCLVPLHQMTILDFGQAPARCHGLQTSANLFILLDHQVN